MTVVHTRWRFYRYYLNQFTSFDSKFAKESATFNRVRRYGGDMAEKGPG